MDLNLGGKTAIVTGASDGIGRAIALELASEGVNVVAVARGEQKLQALEAAGKELAGQLTTLQMDCTTESAGKDIVATALERFGRIDILVNNVGNGRVDRDWSTPDEVWLDTMNTNLYSAVRITRECVPHLRMNPGASIVNMSSISAHSGLANMGDYNASKAGLSMWSKTISRELAPDITVNAVCPGFIRTPLWDDLASQLTGAVGDTVDEVYDSTAQGIPMLRYGTPEEVSGLCAFLVSNRARFITGATLNIDGGYMQFGF
ncbi:SDR family NAD(P)-dependent oxidoreductase [Microbacterium alcoholitolerans]|uniref:SDR family NAD(P)-dependent oxidoreductase n=1 Tax=unclassified Microbacterium TaxID=2609290 RepID=UPI003D1741AF